MKVSVIIPVYNEEKVIGDCLVSLQKQTIVSSTDIIVIDDGSKDNSLGVIENFKLKDENCVLLRQKHGGPGAARNLGASKAKGDILAFVDADMEFAPDFLEKLIAPIEAGKTVGTFSKEECLLNKGNIWARLWNVNLDRQPEKMHAQDYPNSQPVFRAILRKEFEKVGGFDATVGYTDDWTLSRKLGVQAKAAPGAKFYHANPASLKEVWMQARWFGKNEFLTRDFIRRFYNLFRYCPLWAVFKLPDLKFVVFKFVYNAAVFASVLLSFFGEEKHK